MKFVVAGYGSRGDVEPCIAVAAELQRRGHDVQMAVTVPAELNTFVSSAGLTPVPYGRDWRDLLSDNDFTSMMQNLAGAIPQALDYVTRTLTEKTDTLLPLAAGADLIVAGMTEQGAATNIAELQQIPLASLHFFPWQILQGGSMQDGTAAPAGQAHRRRLGLPEQSAVRPLEIQAYDKLCLPRLADEWAGDDRRPFVGALSLGLPADADDDALAWAAAGPPPVYFGFGSTPVESSADMVAVISAACTRVGTRALISLGPNELGGLVHPEHVKVVGEINHATVFPACRAVVHHGGAGTTAAGLRAGMPALILWNGLDQPMWAAAVTHLGVGLGRGFPESTLDSLTADLQVLLAPHCATRAREVAAQMTTAAESLAATADLLENAAVRKP